MWTPVGAVCDGPLTPRRPVGKSNSTFDSPQDTALKIRNQSLEKFGGNYHGNGTGADVGALYDDQMPAREPMVKNGHANEIFVSTHQVPTMLIVGLPKWGQCVINMTLVSVGTVGTAFEHPCFIISDNQNFAQNFRNPSLQMPMILEDAGYKPSGFQSTSVRPRKTTRCLDAN